MYCLWLHSLTLVRIKAALLKRYALFRITQIATVLVKFGNEWLQLHSALPGFQSFSILCMHLHLSLSLMLLLPLLGAVWWNSFEINIIHKHILWSIMLYIHCEILVVLVGTSFTWLCCNWWLYRVCFSTWTCLIKYTNRWFCSSVYSLTVDTCINDILGLDKQ